MWVKHGYKQLMTGNGKFIPPVKMVTTGKWFMTLFYPHYTKHQQIRTFSKRKMWKFWSPMSMSYFYFPDILTGICFGYVTPTIWWPTCSRDQQCSKHSSWLFLVFKKSRLGLQGEKRTYGVRNWIFLERINLAIWNNHRWFSPWFPLWWSQQLEKLVGCGDPRGSHSSPGQGGQCRPESH